MTFGGCWRSRGVVDFVSPRWGFGRIGWAEFRGFTPPAIVVSPFQGFVLLMVLNVPALALRAFFLGEGGGRK